MSSEERAHRVRRGRLGLDSREDVRPPSPWLDIDPPFSPPDTLHFLHLPAGGENLKWLNKAAAAAEVNCAAEFCRADVSEMLSRGHLPRGRAPGLPARWSGSSGGRWHHRGAGVLRQPQTEAGRSAELPRAARAARAVASAGWRCGTTPVSPIFSDFLFCSCARLRTVIDCHDAVLDVRK